MRTSCVPPLDLIDASRVPHAPHCMHSVCPLSLLQVDAGKIPVAHDNSSRGKWPLWQYINAGVNTMHVNVPNMADIIGALLRAPFAALRAYLRCKDLPEELARFYEDGISDSCFNGKWKALEEFNAGLDKQAIPPPNPFPCSLACCNPL